MTIAPKLPPAHPARRLLRLISARWVPELLYCLAGGPRRFTSLRRALPDISPKVLTETLRRLDAAGLVCRRATASIPPQVTYALTPLGLRVREPVAWLCRWAGANADLLRRLDLPDLGDRG